MFWRLRSTPFPFYVCTEMTGEVHICSLQVVVGVRIEAMIYDMCCKQSPCISQGPVTAPAQAVKGSVRHSLIFHLGHTPLAKTGFMYNRLLIQVNKTNTMPSASLRIASSSIYNSIYYYFPYFLPCFSSIICKCDKCKWLQMPLL